MKPSALRDALESIAGNVQAKRAAAGLTQEQVARDADIDIRTFQRIEAAEENLSVDVLVRLGAALDVTPADLLAPAKRQKRSRGRPRRL